VVEDELHRRVDPLRELQARLQVIAKHDIELFHLSSGASMARTRDQLKWTPPILGFQYPIRWAKGVAEVRHLPEHIRVIHTKGHPDDRWEIFYDQGKVTGDTQGGASWTARIRSVAASLELAVQGFDTALCEILQEMVAFGNKMTGRK
jgi:hypothetical protein